MDTESKRERRSRQKQCLEKLSLLDPRSLSLKPWGFYPNSILLRATQTIGAIIEGNRFDDIHQTGIPSKEGIRGDRIFIDRNSLQVRIRIQNGPAKRCRTDVCPAEIRPAEVGIEKVDIGQIGPG